MTDIEKTGSVQFQSSREIASDILKQKQILKRNLNQQEAAVLHAANSLINSGKPVTAYGMHKITGIKSGPISRILGRFQNLGFFERTMGVSKGGPPPYLLEPTELGEEILEVFNEPSGNKR
jgi:predicted transcriptional regulator